jgi:RNA polymerase sigma factor (sigma-70 family)
MSAEERLLRAARLGEPNAFEELVTPSLGGLRSWLGYMLDQDADDCLQEVLLTAWLKLPTLHDQARFRGWLFQIARHKSLDYLRRRQRAHLAEVPLETLDGVLSRHSMAPPAPTLAELTEPLTNAERTAIWLRYAEGLSIDQIAKRRAVTSGTVKRLLYNARNRIKQIAQVSRDGEEPMSATRSINLPATRPLISIKPLDGVSFEVDFQEDPWHFALLEVGSQTQWASYDPPDWRRTSVCNTEVLGKAVVHGEACLEIRADQYENGLWRENATRHYVQVGDQFIKYLAVMSRQTDIPHLNTFLDEHFHLIWGQRTPRFWTDDGRFQVVAENRLVTVAPHQAGGLGYFAVTIGEKVFPCLRVLDTEWATGSDGILVEAYLTQEGRTVLFRRYNGEAWRPASNWLKAAENNQRLTLDGVTYIHWYDCLSSVAVS